MMMLIMIMMTMTMTMISIGETLFCPKKSLNWTDPTPYQNDTGAFYLTVKIGEGIKQYHITCLNHVSGEEELLVNGNMEIGCLKVLIAARIEVGQICSLHHSVLFRCGHHQG